MKRIVIFGNSGAGKSTLAKQLADSEQLAHLDLDVLAWQPTNPPVRKPVSESAKAINEFIAANPAWVIEGCYSDLLELLLSDATDMIYLALPVEQCVDNARRRPWEPHKYASKEEQDQNLDMLIGWIRDYDKRTDTFSKAAHEQLYQQFTGNKQRHTSNQSPVMGGSTCQN